RTQTEVSFCKCQSDQVRLIRMGYIGGSPKFPRTAFSIRLLRFHHIIWKHCAVSITPFSKALDEFLDSNNPLILVSPPTLQSESCYTTRQWRQTISAAIDAYREMIRRGQIISEELLQMGPMDKLANICPKCYGPPVPGKTPEEPDYIVCMDGNFQHRRHLAASQELHQSCKPNTLFISPAEVQEMELSMVSSRNTLAADETLDRCTEQHTAANDTRGTATWKACDVTGIFGLACRHDQILRLINIVQSGEKLNTGWGLSDGEGMERIWAYLSPLISSLRYSTKTHRLVALDLRSSHHNDTGKTNSVRLLLDRGRQVEEAMKTALEKLKEIEDNFGHSTVYLADQWIRQRECQLSAMETESERDMMRQVEELVELEDQLRDTQ
ncbi:hypothetical protein PGT21_011422, partial [Puccinia graminis f. sp. tritici]